MNWRPSANFFGKKFEGSVQFSAQSHFVCRSRTVVMRWLSGRAVDLYSVCHRIGSCTRVLVFCKSPYYMVKKWVITSLISWLIMAQMWMWFQYPPRINSTHAHECNTSMISLIRFYNLQWEDAKSRQRTTVSRFVRFGQRKSKGANLRPRHVPSDRMPNGPE